MRKKDLLGHWQGLRTDLPLTPSPVPYRHEGSTYAEDGIRITGSPQFIDAVLGRLKDLLKFEGTETRLQVSYRESGDKVTREPTGSYQCYVQVHERGDEAKVVNVLATALASRGRRAGRARPVILSRGY